MSQKVRGTYQLLGYSANGADYEFSEQAEQGHPPQVHCLRICAYILKRAINNARDKAIREPLYTAPCMLCADFLLDDNATPADRVTLINAAFDAFSVIAAACEPSRNMEYRTVAIALYNGRPFFITVVLSC